MRIGDSYNGSGKEGVAMDTANQVMFEKTAARSEQELDEQWLDALEVVLFP